MLPARTLYYFKQRFSSFHTRTFRGIRFSLLRHRLCEYGFAGPKRFPNGPAYVRVHGLKQRSQRLWEFEAFLLKMNYRFAEFLLSGNPVWFTPIKHILNQTLSKFMRLPWLAQSPNHKVWDFSTAFRVWKLFGEADFAKRTLGPMSTILSWSIWLEINWRVHLTQYEAQLEGI